MPPRKIVTAGKKQEGIVVSDDTPRIVDAVPDNGDGHAKEDDDDADSEDLSQSSSSESCSQEEEGEEEEEKDDTEETDEDEKESEESEAENDGTTDIVHKNKIKNDGTTDIVRDKIEKDRTADTVPIFNGAEDDDDEAAMCPPCDPTLLHSWRPGNIKDKIDKPKDLEPPPPSHFFDHFPKHPACPICNACKIQHHQHRKRAHGPPDENTVPPVAFGDQGTADHIIMHQGEHSVDDDKCALVIYDRACKWLDGIPKPTNNATHTRAQLKEYYGRLIPKAIYSDNAPELKRACRKLEYPLDLCIPHRPQSNGVSERQVRSVKEGTSCLLEQSGLHALWWNYAMRCYCFLHNVLQKCVKRDGEAWLTPFESRFQQEFLADHVLPFGCEIEYLPAAPKYKKLQHSLGTKLRSGLFFGYYLPHGGKWDHIVYIMDWEMFANQPHPKRCKPTKIHIADLKVHKLANGTFHFPPNQNRTIDTKLPYSTCTPIWINLGRNFAPQADAHPTLVPVMIALLTQRACSTKNLTILWKPLIRF